jgi:hypothetical protein
MGAAVAGVLGAVRIAAVRQALEPLEHDGGTRAVADEPLASAVVALFDVDARVEVEAVVGARMAAVAALGPTSVP